MAQEDTTALADGDSAADCCRRKVVKFQSHELMDELEVGWPTGKPVPTTAVAVDGEKWEYVDEEDSGTTKNIWHAQNSPLGRRSLAVADDEENWARFRDYIQKHIDSYSGTDSNAHSIAGDIVDSEAGDTDDPAVAALRRLEKSAPKNPKQG